MLLIHTILNLSKPTLNLIIFFSLILFWFNFHYSHHQQLIHQAQVQLKNNPLGLYSSFSSSLFINDDDDDDDVHSILTLKSSPPSSSSGPVSLSRAFLEPTLPQRIMSTRCAEAWMSSEVLRCSGIQSKPKAIDLLWTWVNQTTPLASQTSTYGMSMKDSAASGPAYLYRQHDELRFSLRSTMASLPPAFVRSRRIITTDQPLQGWLSRPAWLADDPRLAALKPPLAVLHHYQFFGLPSPNPPTTSHDQESWIQNFVPSFNSLAIESQFGHLTGIRDNFLYLNDDCFLINNFSESDFSTELFGPVFRIQFDLKVADDSKDKSGTTESRGEWPSLGYSNYLLSQRFGTRTRRYLNHLPKVVNIHILREVSEIWKDEISVTGASRFRGQSREVNIMFLTTWYHIEKHREAMLHSFLMLKSDRNQDGMLSDSEWNQMMNDIGYTPGQSEIITVHKPIRARQEGWLESVLGDFRPLQTDYEWFSSDGYPLIDPDSDAIPNYHEQESPPSEFCKLNVTKCFGESRELKRSEDVMRWIGMEHPECGDCLLALLIGRQSSGMELLLPPSTVRTKMAKLLDHRSVFRNAFSSNHKLFNDLVFFSTRRAAATRLAPSRYLSDDPRIWAIRNIQRYQYVLGNTPSDFQSLTTMFPTRMILDRLTSRFGRPKPEAGPKPSGEQAGEKGSGAEAPRREHDGLLVTLNDRIPQIQFAQVHTLFSAWLHASWPRPAPWESP